MLVFLLRYFVVNELLYFILPLAGSKEISGSKHGSDVSFQPISLLG